MNPTPSYNPSLLILVQPSFSSIACLCRSLLLPVVHHCQFGFLSLSLSLSGSFRGIQLVLSPDHLILFVVCRRDVVWDGRGTDKNYLTGQFDSDETAPKPMTCCSSPSSCSIRKCWTTDRILCSRPFQQCVGFYCTTSREDRRWYVANQTDGQQFPIQLVPRSLRVLGTLVPPSPFCRGTTRSSWVRIGHGKVDAARPIDCLVDSFITNATE